MAKIKYDNNGDEIEVPDGTELKEVSRDEGWNIPYGCEDGICGTCIVEIKEGKENLNEMEETEEITLSAMGVNDGNHRLACQCKCKGEMTIKTY